MVVATEEALPSTYGTSHLTADISLLSVSRVNFSHSGSDLSSYVSCFNRNLSDPTEDTSDKMVLYTSETVYKARRKHMLIASGD